MIRYFAVRRRALAAIMSAALLGGAYQGAGCSLTIDESLLEQLSNFEFSFGPGGRHGQGFQGEFEFDHDDHSDDEFDSDSSGGE